MDLYEELVALIDAFDRDGIDYALCGGVAVAFHGYVRFTKDIDVLVEPIQLDSALATAEQLGFAFRTAPLRFAAGTPEECVIHRVSKIEGSEQLVLDLVVVTPVLREVWNFRSEFQFEDRRVKVVSLVGLKLMKQLSGRERDLLDLKELESLDDRGETNQVD